MKKLILVVDDSALVREMYKAQLEEGGCEVVTAVDGIEAINTAFTSLPDLILLDVHMPKINGYQVCRLLKDHPVTKHIPIIIMTARGVGEMVQDPRKWSFQTGADGFYGKEETSTLIPVITTYLENAPVRAKPQAANASKPLSETEIMVALSQLLDRQLYLDITRLKELDEQKDTFVANVSHELRSPLATLGGYLENMQDGLMGPVNAAQLQAIERMRATVKRLSRLIKDILDLSKIAAGKMTLKSEDVDLTAVLRGAFEAFGIEASKKKIQLTLEVPDKPIHVVGEGDRLTQVVINLMSNAVKYTPEGRKVTLRLWADETQARVEVEDTGNGINEESKAKIFDKFERIMTEKQEGTGLGLSIVKDLVNLHGGKIWLESEEGKGSKFIFTLPLNAKGENPFSDSGHLSSQG